MESKDLAVRIAQVLDKKKADSLKVLKVRDLTVLTDYFVIATGSSTTSPRSSRASRLRTVPSFK